MAKYITNRPKLDESILTAIINAFNQNNFLFHPRDKKLEKKIIETHKLELRLLSSIGTREMYEWLDEGRIRGDVYEVGQYDVILKTHRQNIPGLKEFRTSAKALIKISDTMERFLGRIGSETCTQETKQLLGSISQQLFNQGTVLSQNINAYNYIQLFYFGQIIDTTLNMPMLCFQETPLFARCIELCTKLRGSTLNEVVDSLNNHFEMNNDNILDQPILDKRRNWRQVNKQYIEFQNNPILNFYDEYGRYANSVTSINTYNKNIILPITGWEKRGHDNTSFLYVPPKNKYQLFNQKHIKENPTLPIIITDSFALAFMLSIYQQQTNNYQFIITTWYGDIEGTDNVCWLPLNNRTVHYIIHGHPEESIKESNDIAMMTAGKVYKHLSSEEIKSKVFFWDFRISEDGKDICQGNYIDPEDLPINKEDKVSKVYNEKLPDEGNLLTISDIPEDHKRPAFLMDPVIAQKTVNLMYAEAGIGKTWVSLYISCCLACGKNAFDDRWKPEKPCKVLYVDGEMGEDDLKIRLAMIKNHFKGEEDQELLRKNFFFVSIRSKVPDLSTAEGQRLVDIHLEEIRKRTGYHERVAFMVIDNLGVLTLNSDSHTSWGRFFAWLKELKDKGTSSMIIHHTNKKGDQRGTEVKMAAVDNAFFIEGNNSNEDTSLFMTIHVKKGRHIYGSAKKSISVEFTPSENNSNWRFIDTGMTEKGLQERIKEWTISGWSNAQMAASLDGMNINTFKVLKKSLGVTRKYKKKNKVK